MSRQSCSLGTRTYPVPRSLPVIQERPEASLAQGKVNGDRIWAAHNFNEVRPTALSSSLPYPSLTPQASS